VGGEPRLGRLAEPTLLLGRHHLERIAVARAAFRLHLDEHEVAAAADDEVELVPADPDVPLEDPVATQSVEPPRAPLGSLPLQKRASGVPDAFLGVRRLKGQCSGTALRPERGQGREPAAEPGSDGL